MGKTRDLLKKIRDTKGTFQAKMSTIKDRNDMDLTEAEVIKKRWQEYTEEQYRKDLQSLSHVQLFAIPWTAAHQASLSITKSWSLLKLMSIESMMPSNHFILCCPFLLPPSIFPKYFNISKSSLNIWKFTAHVLLKLGLEKFEHYFASV